MKAPFRSPAVPSFSTISARCLWLMGMLAMLAGFQQAMATTLVSVVPANGATGVSPATTVVFTFSGAVIPSLTVANLLDNNASESPDVISNWNAGNTVLTLTPSPQFANNHLIQWSVGGEDAQSNALTGTLSGSFTTVAGVNGGSGTNSQTTYVVGKYSFFQQTNAAGPAFHSGYEFFSQVELASNRTATSATVTLPSTVVSNLDEDGLTPEQFQASALSVNGTNFSNSFPAGTYTFNVTGSPSQQVMIGLGSFAQPNAPLVSNYTAGLSVNPTQPFTLTWNTFTNGTGADWTYVLVTSGGITWFETPQFGRVGALNGLSNAVTIPAGKLPLNTGFTAVVAFYHGSLTTNGSTVAGEFVATATTFAMSTITNTTAASPVLSMAHSGTNVVLSWPTNATGFRLIYSTDLATSSWSSNLPAATVVGTNKVVTNGITGTQRYYRLINP